MPPSDVTSSVAASYFRSHGFNYVAAIAGKDYTSVAGRLDWADGDTADKFITVPVVNDRAATSNKIFGITIGPVVGEPGDRAIECRRHDPECRGGDDIRQFIAACCDSCWHVHRRWRWRDRWARAWAAARLPVGARGPPIAVDAAPRCGTGGRAARCRRRASRHRRHRRRLWRRRIRHPDGRCAAGWPAHQVRRPHGRLRLPDHLWLDAAAAPGCQWSAGSLLRGGRYAISGRGLPVHFHVCPYCRRQAAGGRDPGQWPRHPPPGHFRATWIRRSAMRASLPSPIRPLPRTAYVGALAVQPDGRVLALFNNSPVYGYAAGDSPTYAVLRRSKPTVPSTGGLEATAARRFHRRPFASPAMARLPFSRTVPYALA